MKKYLITGGGFANKGAESMLYTLISELRAHGDCDITVHVVHGFEFANHCIPGIKFIPFSFKEREQILNPFVHLCNRVKLRLCKIFGLHCKNKLRLYRAIKNADIVIDISGYSLSSQWDYTASHHIPHTIEIAKKYGKQVILLPQSFGPFDFTKKHKLSKKYLKNILGYADVIFCREEDGFEHMRNLGLTNIYKSSDIVIQSTKSSDIVLTNSNNVNIPEIIPNSVLIVPNMRVIERTDKNKMMQLYSNTIETLLEHGKHVYLTYYDLGDIAICNEIKSMFADESRVIFLQENLDCMNFNKILPNFDFIISSRFHSIVHAYRHGIPAVVIGWAIKYSELLESVNQQAMLYDGRYDINIDDFLSTVKHLLVNRTKESDKINACVHTIQQNSCFNKMWEIIEK